MSFYYWYDRANGIPYLKYFLYLVLSILTAYESFISIGLLSVEGQDFSGFILRFSLRFALPVLLWSCLERAAWQFLCCYHSDCPGMSVSIHEVSIQSQELELLKELGLTMLYVILTIICMTQMGIPESSLFDLAFSSNPSAMMSRSWAQAVEIVSVPILVGQIQVTVALISFEDKFANHFSCPDTTVKRWSRLKGTIVVMTMGLCVSAFLRLVTRSHEGAKEVIPHIPWSSLLVGVLVFLSTHKRRWIRMVALCLWVATLLRFGSGQSETSSSSQGFQSAVHYAMAGMVSSWICAGRHLYRWSSHFKQILRHCIALGCLAVLASDVRDR